MTYAADVNSDHKRERELNGSQMGNKDYRKNIGHVALIFPKIGLYGEKPDRPPLGILTIAAPLVQAGYHVTILDERAEKNFESQLHNILKTDLICTGISSMSGHHIKNALRISKIIKENSSFPVVLGGVQASIAPESLINHELIDIIVLDDGEEIFLNLVKCIEQKTDLEKVEGIAFKQSSKIHFTDPANPADINKNPLIPFHLIDFNKYEPSVNWSWMSGKRIIPMETSRGCPYSCSFCTESVRKKKWRALPPERVINDIKYYIDLYGVTNYTFIDDNFFGVPERAERIIDLLIEGNLGIRWYTNIRADFLARVSNDFIEKLEISGCRMLTFGAESGSPRILKMINKGASVEDVLTANKKLSKSNIIPHYVTIRGFPTETKEELIKTFLLNINLLFNNQNAILDMPHLIPTPGTKIALQCLGDKVYEYTLEDWSKIFELEDYGKSEWILDETYDLMINTKEFIRILWGSRFQKKWVQKKLNNLLLLMIKLSLEYGFSSILNKLLKLKREVEKKWFIS